MKKTMKRKWKARRVISWMLASVMAVSAFSYGGIPGARVVEAAYSSTSDNDLGTIKVTSGELLPGMNIGDGITPKGWSIALLNGSGNTSGGSYNVSYAWSASGVADEVLM